MTRRDEWLATLGERALTKLVSLAHAVGLVPDGDAAAVRESRLHRIPATVARELARRDRRCLSQHSVLSPQHSVAAYDLEFR